jgi:hypothetical protein
MTSLTPFSLPGRWFKGNLHTHTTQSDGDHTPEQAEAWYREHGYDFLAITDHWVLTQGHKGDGFITITGAELHGEGYHMLTLGLSALPDQALADSPQEIVNAVVAAGGQAYFAHPYWTGQPSSHIAPIQGIHGIEVFNSVCEKMIGKGYALVHWDDLLGSGRRLNGLAVDDVHWRHGAQGGGWVMVRAASLAEDDILDALRQGYFYASTGPSILDLRIVSNDGMPPRLEVVCSPCSRITFHARGPYGQRFDAPPEGTFERASCALRKEQLYLRVECRDAQGGAAWTNPLFVDEILSGGMP